MEIIQDGKWEVVEGTGLANDNSTGRLLAILEMADTNILKFVLQLFKFIVDSLLFWSIEEGLKVLWSQKGVLMFA